MLVQAIPYPAGGSSGDPTLGALVYRGSDLTFASGTNAVTFDAETYDYGGYHSTGSDTDRLTIPSGITRGRLVANGELATANRNISQLKNGASFVGTAVGFSYNAGQAGTPISPNFASAIVSVTTGDYFSLSGTGAITYNDLNTWLAFEPVDAAIKGALVKKSATQSISAGATTTLTWPAEEYDTDGFHDNATNNSRLTVPSGVTLIRVSASVQSTDIGVNDQGVLTMLKNGASVRGGFAKDSGYNNGAPLYLSAVSAILAVSTSDYFEAQVFYTAAETVAASDDTWFQIEEIPATRKYAVVYKSASQSMTVSTWTALAFGAELADTDGFHDNATNNTRLTVPSGCTRVRLSFNVKTASISGSNMARVLKNGNADVPGMPSYTNNTSGTDSLNGFGAWVDVAPGDYFELQFYNTGSNYTLGTDNETWFCIEAA